MYYPTAPIHMFQHRNKKIKNFIGDSETKIDYKFNSLGYRSDIEFKLNKKPIILLGDTISFGLGLKIQDTFSHIIASHFKKPVYNFSWGCYAHTNYEQLNLLKSIFEVDEPSLIIFQINGLNRYRNNGVISFNNPKELIISEYKKFYVEISKLLKNKKHIFLYWDNEEHAVRFPPCLIKNRYIVDTSLKNKITAGKKSNKLIALKIINEITEKKIYE